MDLLSMPHAERAIVTWLSRNPDCTLEQICEALSSPPEDVQLLLAQLINSNHLNSAETDGETTFTVNYSARKTRRAHSLPTELWKKAGLDSASDEKNERDEDRE